MASKNARVNGRGHRTSDDKATCTTCKATYNNWKCLNEQGICFKCEAAAKGEKVTITL